MTPEQQLRKRIEDLQKMDVEALVSEYEACPTCDNCCAIGEIIDRLIEQEAKIARLERPVTTDEIITVTEGTWPGNWIALRSTIDGVIKARHYG